MPFALATAADLADIVTLQNAAVAQKPNAFGTRAWSQGDAQAQLDHETVVTYRDSTNTLRGFVCGRRIPNDLDKLAFYIAFICIDPTLTLALTLRTVMDGIKTFAANHGGTAWLVGRVDEDDAGWTYFSAQNYLVLQTWTRQDGVLAHLIARAVTGTVG